MKRRYARKIRSGILLGREAIKFQGYLMAPQSSPLATVAIVRILGNIARSAAQEPLARAAYVHTLNASLRRNRASSNSLPERTEG